jgi:hypothetical protein
MYVYLRSFVTGCYVPTVGAIGYFVNGIPMYGWGDGTTYDSEGVSIYSIN